MTFTPPNEKYPPLNETRIRNLTWNSRPCHVAQMKDGSAPIF